MWLVSLLLSFFIIITPSSNFICDGDQLKATIRNNLNGDFSITNDLENIDEGAFVVLDWRDIKLMLPVTFNVGEISFTDKKWLWSYQDNENGLYKDNPRLLERLPSGGVVEHLCHVM
ncbi:hypothetical protein [Prochlorococcus marinus]|uniref:hypothetical protein n=1 Tax=Prochlorococcus marinus TaxID=1219 RepID=UPI0022B2E238|nr:hypothetical protein [Prochlorococcus marinus]